jgi:hypothetical protein
VTRPVPLVLGRAVELHRRLGDAGVPHALGGALALAYHVREPRATNDVDLNVSADAAHPLGVLGLLPTDIAWTDADVEAIRRDGQVRLWWSSGAGPPTPIDLFFPQHALHAAAAEVVPMLDTTVPILAATHLTVFKALFDRRKDWADIEEMVRAGAPDLVEVERWLGDIVGSDDGRIVQLRQIAAEVAAGGDDPPTFSSAARPRPTT